MDELTAKGDGGVSTSFTGNSKGLAGEISLPYPATSHSAWGSALALLLKEATCVISSMLVPGCGLWGFGLVGMEVCDLSGETSFLPQTI